MAKRTSTWAGSWTGVLALADFPSREIRIPWHNMAYTTGRVAITAHMVDHAQITVATVYGYAKGPTFPHAHAHTDELLQNLTTHLVLGQTGARVILGDLNATESQLPQLAIWKEQGWIECQTLALHRWGAPIRHTCKGATQRDYIYLSPEAAALCHEVSIENHFHEHSTVSIRLQLEEAPRAQQVWKHPATIPWDQVILYNDFIGWAVARWFSQLRRLQSLKHAINGCNNSEQAKENITLHWNSILRAKGFAPRFLLWWPTRKIKLLGSPADLQRVQLTPDTVDQIYDDFHQNFRDFEAFHNRSRNQVLKERYDANQHLIYKFLRRTKPSLVDSLLEEKHATILAYDPDTQQVHLDCDMQLTQSETLGQVDGIPATITNQSNDLAQIHMETTPLPGQALTLNSFITKEEELHRQFHDEWSQRWNKHAQIPEEQWARILNFGYHFLPKGEYPIPQIQPAFLPTVQTYSYVDNLAVQAYTAGELLRAWIAYLAFCDMWQIEPDTEKSLAWSLDPKMTQQAQLIGPHVVTEMKDLGGHMTFKIKQTSRPTTTKTQSIDWEWERLRRAPAPYNQKTNALFIKFWPAIFYGTSISQVTDKAVHQLRTQATKALQAQRAGSNALLRLCLCPNMLADPGFFRLQMVIRELRRMCRKLPALVGLWRAFHRRFDGTLFAGPFSQVLTCLNQIGWLLLEPPLIKDHNGCVHDLLDIDHKLLRLQLQEAWAQHVAKQVQHRKTMSDLEGLDLHLSNPDTGRLTALQLARVRALQDGSFRLATQHAKYDATNTGQCKSCGVPETVEHLCLHCPALQSHRRDHEWLAQHWPDLPTCLTHHLLVPRLKGHADYIQALHNTPDVSDRFEEFEMQYQTYNLFTDGSCVPHTNPALSLASWAVYCVEEDLTIAGPLQGIAQTIQRAELVGILSAVTWAARTTRTVRIWTDCQMCIDGWAHEENHKRHHGLANMDLWCRVIKQNTNEPLPSKTGNTRAIRLLTQQQKQCYTAENLVCSPFVRNFFYSKNAMGLCVTFASGWSLLMVRVEGSAADFARPC
ncbi:unnamed protein product [Effrenium voratum]|nr:unnamed protein product [Effrenium voratum]